MKTRSKTAIFTGLGLMLVFSLRGQVFALREHSLDSVEEVLSAKTCQVWDDPQGIPHLRAGSELNGLACLGFIHGRDRAWQMEFFRRAASGTRAEVLGWDFLKPDLFARILEFKERGQLLFKQMDLKNKKRFLAYSRGVNRGFREAEKKGIYEFKKIPGKLEPWTPEDTISIVLLQSFDQTRRAFQIQLDEEKAMSTYGESFQELLKTDLLPWSAPVLKKGEYTEELDSQSKDKVGKILEPVTAPEQEEAQGGSNNWVIHSSRSLTGHAWMANDPHLQLSYPPFWQWIHLETDRLDLMGSSFPGTPFFLTAANRNVSWGLTNAFLPVAQVSLVPSSELKSAPTFRPWVWIKVWKLKVPFFFKTFQKTKENLPTLPIPDGPKGHSYVFRWSGFDLNPEDLTPLFDLFHAKDVREADQALGQVGVPGWNLVFADVRGQIGYRAIGRTPRFGKDFPVGVPKRHLDEVHRSTAFMNPLLADEMPHILNPKRGFVASANNRQWDSNSRWNAGRAQLSSFRAFRIEELIQKTQKHTLDSLQEIQCDHQAVDARFILPKLLSAVSQENLVKAQDSRVRSSFEILRKWNFETGLDCKACGIYRRWVDLLMEKKELTSATLFLLLEKNENEDFKKELLDFLVTALEDLKVSEKGDFPLWRDLHQAVFLHLAGEAWYPVKRSFSTFGDENTVNLGKSEWKDGIYRHTSGPSERVIVEMSNPPQVYSILPGINQDLEDRNDTEGDSDLQKWLKCKVERRNFPVDWSKLKNVTHIDLNE